MIDLQKEFKDGAEGVFHLSGGEIGYTDAVPYDDGTFGLRYESGWRTPYRNDGVRPFAGRIIRKDGSEELVPGGDKRNIVRFERMTWSEAVAKYPGIAPGFHP